MTSPITGLPLTGTSNTDVADTITKKAVLGKDDFLRILVSQLKNQDPLNPMQGTEFATQLAQFSSVEQLIQIGSKLDAQSASTAATQLTQQTALGTTLIGHDVLMRGATFTAVEDKIPRITIDLPAAAKKVSVEVIDADGETLFTQEFDGVATGRQTLTLDDETLDPGQYTYKITAMSKDNKLLKPTTYTTALVEGISFQGGAVMLRMNGQLVSMDEIVEVMSAAPASDPVIPNEENPTP